MSVKHLLLTAMLIVGISVQQTTAQNRNCGSMEYLEQQQENDPKRTQKLQRIENHTRSILTSFAPSTLGTVTIPVVVHVVYNNNTENISDAQIQSQITVLNDDFRRNNADQNNTWSQAADSNIEFCLASVDPNGNSTSGITRTSTSVSAFGTNDAVKSSSTGGVNAWPASDYLNIWVCDIGGGILGYAQFPGGSPSTDGVVNDYRYFGTTGTASAPFDLGRTMTHEVGHYLNLRHIWGDGNCNADDFVNDTPTSDAANYGCASGHVSCSSTDMVQNYMDYSDDACMNLFTQGQADRMCALFESGGARESLLNSTACGGGGGPLASCNDGIQNQGETGIDCGGPCTACPSNCTDNEVTISITFDNYPEETSWTLSNASGATVASGGTYGNQADGSTITETFCLVDGCYDFTINDTYGDGICCSYGNGAYSVTDASGNLASGGSFTTAQTTNFCLGGGATATCNDGIQNQGETDVDCGGPCTACETCNDGIQNQGETDVDCGGPCTACETCNDGIQNQGETDVDCGGPCSACETCNDGIQNQGETGVDCGGPCTPCGGGTCTANEVTIRITFDNYPEETSWTITDGNGSVVGSGGIYGNQADGSTIVETVCLGDGCYDFTINDLYGDGICCSYGNGAYSVNDASGNLAFGGSFATAETTNICLGNSGPTPTCNDGIQNQGETGVDCGGPCTPCGGNGACSHVLVDNNNFEGGWGIWNDGGSDARRSANDAAYAIGTYCIRLRDNTSSSTMTTDNLNLASYEEVTVDFSYYARSMENNEDFWLQVSTNGGSSYTTVASWASGSDFTNDTRNYDGIVLTGTFTSTTRFRFRCDASANADFIYIDDVAITGCTNSSRIMEELETKELTTTPAISRVTLAEKELISNLIVYPNPTSDRLTVAYEMAQAEDVQLVVTDFTGKILQTRAIDEVVGSHQIKVDASQLTAGFYFVHLVTDHKRYSQKFVVVK